MASSGAAPDVEISALGGNFCGGIGNNFNIIGMAVAEFSFGIFHLPPVPCALDKGNVAAFRDGSEDVASGGSCTSDIEPSAFGGDYSRHGIGIYRIGRGIYECRACGENSGKGY